MMKTFCLLILGIFATSCEVTETLRINADNSGTIEYDSHRNENSYMQIAKEEYSKETVFKDTSYVFQEYIDKYKANFSKYAAQEQDLFAKFNNVKVHIKKSAFEKEFRTTITQDFKNVEAIADLSKTQDYADDLVNNYALTAEKHYYNIRFTLSENQFKRIVTITNDTVFKSEKEKFKNYKTRLASYNLVQTYILNYHFPRKIKTVSNPNAIVSIDKKSLVIEFKIIDFLENPSSTNLEVLLE